MNAFAHEIEIGGVYFSPILVVLLLAFFATSFTTLLLNRFKLSQYIAYPPLAFLAIMTLYTLLIDAYFIKI